MVSCTVTTSWKHKRTKMITDQFIFAGLGQFTFSSKSKQISTCQYKQSILIAFTKIISEYLMKLLFFFKYLCIHLFVECDQSSLKYSCACHSVQMLSPIYAEAQGGHRSPGYQNWHCAVLSIILTDLIISITQNKRNQVK